MESDFFVLLKKVYTNRLFVVKIVSGFIVIGLVIAFLSPVRYSTETIMVSQSSSKRNIGGNLAGLAAMAGVNLGALDNSDLLAPSVYPQIVNSIQFQKELMNYPYYFSNLKEPVSLMEYYSNPTYQKNRFWKTLAKYTIYLPETILKKGNVAVSDQVIKHDSLILITSREYRIIKKMRKSITLTNNVKNGYMTLKVEMNEPLLTAQISEKAITLLQKFIIEYKVRKARSYLQFVTSRFNDARADYENKNRLLARYVDENMNTVSSIAKIKEEMLRNEYSLSYNLYSDLARELEQAKITVEENTPLLTVLEPPAVPMERSRPKRSLILITFIFIGVFVSFFTILIWPNLKAIFGNKSWINLVKM